MICDCDNCKHSEVWAYSEPCNSCFDLSEWEADTQTNADRIRAMTDEELAYFHVGIGCPPGIDVYEKCHDIGAVPPVCLKCWLEWLKQEVSEDG